MKYITAKEAAEKWQISTRRVQIFCNENRIDGAYRFGKSYMIPENAEYPTRMKKSERQNKEKLPMPRKSPFLDMTDLYTKAGTADECIKNLAYNPEAQALFAAEIAYSRGEIDKVIEYANEFLLSRSGFYAVNAGGMLLALAAMWKGDISLYRQAKIHICEAPWKTPEDKQIMQVSLACINTSIHDLSDYPDWFRQGQFEHLHPDSHPAAKVFYVKYFIVAAQEQAKGMINLPDVTGMGLMRVIPYIAEPLIARVVAEKLVVPEIYLRLLTAIAYHQLGDDYNATIHIDKAIDLALPDNLLGILAEHRRNLDTLLDDRLLLKDEKALAKLKELHKGLREGFTKLHNSLLSRNVSNALTAREREVARLAAFGLQNKEISARLNIEIATVRKIIVNAMNKTGVEKRRDLGAFV